MTDTVLLEAPLGPQLAEIFHLRNPKFNLLFLCSASSLRSSTVETSKNFQSLKMGPPNCLSGSCPIGHQLPDPVSHPRKIANLRQPKTRRVEFSFACTQEVVTYVCPHPYTSSPCLHIVLITSILISSYNSCVGLPRDFSSSLPTKVLYA